MNTITNESITEKVIEFACDQVGASSEDVSIDTNFVADLGFDSLDVAEFSMRVEDEFDIEIPQEKAEEITTVGKAVQMIHGAIS